MSGWVGERVNASKNNIRAKLLGKITIPSHFKNPAISPPFKGRGEKQTCRTHLNQSDLNNNRPVTCPPELS